MQQPQKWGADIGAKPVSSGGPRTTPIPREVVQEAYDAAALTVARIRSDDLNDDHWDDDGTLPYYEGKRDALRALLEPQADA